MIAMRPIREYDVIDLLNNGRFEEIGRAHV